MKNTLSILFGSWQKRAVTMCTLCVAIFGAWQCYNDAEKTRIAKNNNIESIPSLHSDVARIDKRYTGDSTDRLIKAKDWGKKRFDDSSNFADSLKVLRKDLDFLYNRTNTEPIVYRGIHH